MGFGAFAATLQFYLYGRRYLTASGWTRTSASYDVAALYHIDLKGAEECHLTLWHPALGLLFTRADTMCLVVLCCR